jgi:C4-dicarboxylate-specific signal transduction histidine kinase
MRGLGVEHPNAVGALGAVQWTVRGGLRTMARGRDAADDAGPRIWEIAPRARGSAHEIHRAVWNSIPATAVVVDRTGVIVEVNQRWAELAESVGREDAFIGTNYLDVARWAGERGDASAAEAASGIAGVLRGTDDEFLLDYCCAAPRDSDERWFRLRALRLEPPTYGVLITHDDITEFVVTESMTRRRLDDLTHMQRLATLGELATAIAHDLNQPLTVIMTAASTIHRLLNGRPDDDQLKPIARDILDAASRAADVMKRTRAIVRHDDPILETIGVNEIVSGVVRLLKSDVVIRQVSVELNLDPRAGAVVGGRAQLEQVLMNLLLNAIEAVSEQPQDARNVVVTTRRVTETEVEIRVHDTGLGIPEPLRDRVFEPFVTTKRQGTGLGLAIVRAIVQAHGGQVLLETPEERGAAFRVTLPAC